MTPREWTDALAETVGWQPAYKIVADEAKAILDLLQPDPPMTTAELVEAMFPARAVTEMRGPDINRASYARRRMFKALAAQSKHEMLGWWKPGESRTNKFKVRVTPLVWFAPAPKATNPVLELLRDVMGVLHTTDEEHEMFLDSGADSIQCLWDLEPRIRAAIAHLERE